MCRSGLSGRHRLPDSSLLCQLLQSKWRVSRSEPVKVVSVASAIDNLVLKLRALVV